MRAGEEAGEMRSSLALLALGTLLIAALAAGFSLLKLLAILAGLGFLSGAAFGAAASSGGLSRRVRWALKGGLILGALIPLAAALAIPLAVAGLVIAAAGEVLSAFDEGGA
ncbi:MAG: hypothetical protein DRO01_01580 [Thermoproteota archaeon]|nr:MAG: hypothetical protein DRO01_01580 [Candidatus Korarchaeota archaeon]